MSALVCSRCGTVGEPKTVTKGTFLVEILLWLLFCLPGVIYTAWRLTTRGKACSSCGSENLVPVDSPVGKKLRLESAPSQQMAAAVSRQEGEVARDLRAHEAARSLGPPASAMRPCPHCGRSINAQATTCMYCWAKVPTGEG